MATETGWALYANGIRDSGYMRFAVGRGESPGMRFVRFRKWLGEMTFGPKVPKLDLIVYEQAHHRGGAATAVGVGFVTVLLEFCAQFDIQHTSVHSLTLKKWVTGSGRASKEEVMGALARRFDFTTTNDNEADAVAMLEYARAEVVPQMV